MCECQLLNPSLYGEAEKSPLLPGANIVLSENRGARFISSVR